MESTPAVGLRVCRKCSTEKPLSDFVPCKRSAEGRKHQCKACHAEYQLARWRKANPDRPTRAERWAVTEEERTARLERDRVSARERQEAYRRRKGMPERIKGRDPEKVAAQRERNNAARRTGKQKFAMTRDERLAKRRANVMEKAKNAEYMRAKRRQNPEGVRAKERERTRARYAADLVKSRQKGNRDAHRRRARLAGCDMRVVTQRDLDRQACRQRGECWWCGEAKPLTIDHNIPIAKGGRHAVGNIVMACESCNKGRCDVLPIDWRVELFARELEAA